jgi:hypothetical protein
MSVIDGLYRRNASTVIAGARTRVIASPAETRMPTA